MGSGVEVGRMSKQLTFVALGDSLTVGFQSFNLDGSLPEIAPYTYFLDQIIADARKRFKSIPEVRLVNRGVTGELTEDMLHRFERDVIAVKPSCVVILGGSNDLGVGLSPDGVFSNLKQMYTTALEYGIKPIACTVPSILGFDSLIPQRMKLNGLIKRHCSERKILCADTFKTTADPQTQRLLEVYSNDGLHLSTEGYKRLAETIFQEAVKKILSIP